MKPSSAKAKGRRFQQYVRDKILATFPHLEPDDVRSTSMGASGEDVLLSPAARKLFGFSVECKNLARSAVYGLYEQAVENAGPHTPLLVLKANRKNPLAILDLDDFMKLIGANDNSGSRSRTKDRKRPAR